MILRPQKEKLKKIVELGALLNGTLNFVFEQYYWLICLL